MPGRQQIKIEHLVCDVNGTLALDGNLLDGVENTLKGLGEKVTLHILTADTHGRKDMLADKFGPNAVRVIEPGNEASQKADYVDALGRERVIAIGQGANDAGMLKSAIIGIAVLSSEGVAIETLTGADLLVPNIYAALELLQKPLRLVASLRK